MSYNNDDHHSSEYPSQNQFNFRCMRDQHDNRNLKLVAEASVYVDHMNETSRWNDESKNQNLVGEDACYHPNVYYPIDRTATQSYIEDQQALHNAHDYFRDHQRNYRASPYFSQFDSGEDSPKDSGVSARDPSTIFRKSPYFTQESRHIIEGTSTSGSSEVSTFPTARPTPAKSAFMCFSDARNREIAKVAGITHIDGSVEAVANEWRSLSQFERSHWERMASQEKVRYSKEKQAYKGPLTRKLRAKKNPLAPKRPMSAFLMYAQKKRKNLQNEHPTMSNADISRLLGEIWNKADEDEKKPFLEREEKERKVYRAKMESWKADQKVAAAMAIPAACPEANAARTFYQPEMREEPSTSHEKSGAESSFHREDAASFTKEEASHVNDGKFKFYQISLVFSSHIFDAYISCIYLPEHYLPTPYAEGNQETFHINNCANYSYDSRNQGQSKTPSNLYNSCCGYPTQRSNVKYIYPRPDVERPYSI